MMARLGDVCTISSSNAPILDNQIWLLNLDMVEQQTGNIISYNYVGNGELNGSIVQFDTDNVLYSKLRPNLNKVVIPDRSGFATSEMLPLKPNTSVLCREYLAAYLRSDSFVSWAVSKTAGAKMPRLGTKVLLDKEIPLPPLEEQRRIAALLDKVSDLIAKRRAQLDKLDLLVKARFVETTENSETVPTRMGDVATYINGYAFKPTNWSENGLPIIRIQNLNNVNAEYNYFNGVLPEKYLVRRGDVLVSWATHLEAYIWKGHDAWLNQHIFKVVFDKMSINDVYFVYSTEKALRQAFRNAHGFKPTMEHIKRSDFEDAVIRLPNVEVQNKFAKFAAQVDKSKLTIQQSLDKLEILKKALMQQCFG